MYCRHCGAELKEGASFCYSCEKFQEIEDNSKPQTPKESNKKTFYKRWWFWLIAVLLISVVGIFGRYFSTEAASTPADIDLAINLIESTMEDSSFNYKISYAGNIISIDVLQDGSASCAQHAASGDKKSLALWNRVVESQVECCASIYGIVEVLGLSDVYVMFNLQNDINSENVLLSIMNDEVLYNYVSVYQDSETTEPVSESSATMPIGQRTETLGEANALEKAKSRLKYSPYSRSELIERLVKYDGYTTQEATYAANNCGADWNRQAVLAAQKRLKYSAYSRSDLIERLIKYDGFTQAEAEQAAAVVGY